MTATQSRFLRIFLTAAKISIALAIMAWLMEFDPVIAGFLLAWASSTLVVAQFVGPIAGLTWSGIVGLAVAILFICVGLRFSKPPTVPVDVMIALVWTVAGVLAGYCLYLVSWPWSPWRRTRQTIQDG
jgi:hypothetical protein